MMKNVPRTILLASAAIAVIGTGAIAASVGRVATIDIPGNKFDNFDIGYVDSNASRYYIADRSNAAIDIFDTQKNIFVGRVGFVGIKISATGGRRELAPNGLAFVPTSELRSATACTVKVIVRQSASHRHHPHGRGGAPMTTLDPRTASC
jgi:hypothetical protein